MRSAAIAFCLLAACSSKSKEADKASGVAVATTPPTNGAAFAVGAPRFSLGTHPDFLAFSPDGKRLAACGQDAHFAIWEVATGKQLAHAEPFYRCTAMTWMLDGTHVAVAGIGSFTASGAPIAMIDAETGKISGQTTIEGDDTINAVFARADGKLAAKSGSGFRLWDGTTSRSLAKLDWKLPSTFTVAARGDLVAYHGPDGVAIAKFGDKPLCSAKLSGSVNFIAIAPGGSSFAVSIGKDVVQLAVPTCAVTATKPLPFPVTLDVTTDGTVVATKTLDDDAIQILRWPFDGQPVSVPAGSTMRTARTPSALCPDGHQIAVATATGARVYDLGPTPTAQPPGHREAIDTLAIWNDGTVITVSDDATIVWRDKGTVASVVSVPGAHVSTGLDPAGKRVAIASYDGKTYLLDLVDLDTMASLGHRAVNEMPEDLAWQGDRVLAGGRGKALAYELAADVEPKEVGDMWDSRMFASSRDGKYVLSLHANLDSTPSLELYGLTQQYGRAKDDNAANTNQLAVGSKRVAVSTRSSPREAPGIYGLAIYSVPEMTPVELTAPVDGVCAVAYGPNDQLFAGYTDGRISVLGADGKPGKTFHSGARVSALAVSDDGTQLVSSHADGAVYVWAL